jgi:hypothetical protein
VAYPYDAAPTAWDISPGGMSRGPEILTDVECDVLEVFEHIVFGNGTFFGEHLDKLVCVFSDGRMEGAEVCRCKGMQHHLPHTFMVFTYERMRKYGEAVDRRG